MAEQVVSELTHREGHTPTGIRIGVTGPPGAGKSTLLMRLALHCRTQNKRFATVAVDPSSPRSGGSLLGDRARMRLDPEDDGVFFRSMATGGHHGGLSHGAAEAAEILSHAFDLVCLETTGVGQSETEVSDAADLVVMVIQPGSGDSLQFIKAGIMEIPDILVVNKSDLASAEKSAADIAAAYSVLRQTGSRQRQERAILTSALEDTGIEGLYQAIHERHQSLDLPQKRELGRRARAANIFRKQYGTHGVKLLGGIAKMRHMTVSEGSVFERAERLRKAYLERVNRRPQ